MKKALIAVGIMTLLAGCSDNEVGDVSLGFFTMKDIKMSSLDDDKIAGVTCHIASIEANLSLSDQVIALSLVVKQVKSHQK